MDRHLPKRADDTRAIQVAARLVTLVAFFLLITVSPFLRHRLTRAAPNTRPLAPEDGKPVTLYFRTERNSNPKLFFLLYGSWQGTELVLEDRGTLTYSKASTDTKNRLKLPPPPPQNTQITLHYGEKDEFEALCPSPS